MVGKVLREALESEGWRGAGEAPCVGQCEAWDGSLVLGGSSLTNTVGGPDRQLQPASDRSEPPSSG
jgi:hypothetical protein